MAKKGSYPRDIAIISVIFIFLIVFLAIINLYISTQLRNTFLNAQQERIYSLVRFCLHLFEQSDNEKTLRTFTDAFNIGRLIITDSSGKKIYDSALRFPGIIFDETKGFKRLPDPDRIIYEQGNVVYHNPQPDLYIYLINIPDYTPVDNIFRWHLFYITLSLIFISFLGFFLIRNLFLPMRYVASVARRYGIEMKKEDFVPATFNELFNKLKDKEKELHEFSAYIAHEFRNSLATIVGLARLIEKGKKEPKEIIKECNSMEGLIANLIEYSRPSKLMKTEFKLSNLLEETLKRINISEQITIEREYNYQNKVYADYELMLGALINILKNSIEAIDNAGTIKLKTNIDEDSVIISIADTGRGIPQDEIKNIFSPFYSKKESGIGLGLAFVKKVIDMHNGKIAVESKLGRGTEFIIRIPQSP